MNSVFPTASTPRRPWSRLGQKKLGMVIPMRVGIVLLAFLLGACGNEPTVRAITAQTVLADGSSTVYPLTHEAARRFERANANAHIDVKFSGTTGGFRHFCAGETDISNASRSINAEEKAQCESNGVRYLELPLAMDSMAIVVHPHNTWTNDITVAELKKLWSPEAEGKVNTWKDVRADWPDRPIALFGRGQDSGTYDYFTTVIVGETRSSRKDYFGSEDEELLASKIANEPNALGFFGIGGYHRHWDELKLVAVDDGQGPVFPTLETVKNGSYTPLTRPLYLYVNEDSLASKTTLRPFLDAYLSGITSWIHFTGYMPLAGSSYAESLERLRKTTLATSASSTRSQ